MKPTQEQVIAWARESHMQSHHARDVWAGHIVNLENVAALAYEAGRKDENDACQEICNRHRETIAGVIHHAIRARREQ
jgi:hypothetical protein